jgi:hypothetical protein
MTPTCTVTTVITATLPNTLTQTGTPTSTATYTATITPTNTSTFAETFSYTATATITGTITATSTKTVTSTYTHTISLTATPVATAQSSTSVILEYKTTESNTTTSSPHPWFRLYNNGSSGLLLSRVEIRYWYKYEGTGQGEQAYVDSSYKMLSGTNVGSYTNITITGGTFGTQDRYLKITFTDGAGTLNADTSAYIEVQTRFNKSDWSAYDQSNDWSYANYSDYTSSNYTGVYIDGVLAWGYEPGSAGILGITNNKISKKKASAELADDNCYNYPNPFSGVTTIRFSMNDSEDVSIRITDINGRLVWHKLLPGEEVHTGINEIVWNGVNDNNMQISNGIYMCEVATRKKAVRKAMAFIK